MIGPNGAGKTTLFNLITGIYQPDAGEILLDGESLVGLPPHTITQRGVARTFQTLRLFLNMTVMENVMAAQYGQTKVGIVARCSAPRAMRREEREIRALAEEKLAFFGERLMGYRWNQPAYSLSYANRRRLEIARAMATEPRILLLDEPAAGMNPVETHEITELIGKLRDEGGYTILADRARHARGRGHLRPRRRARPRRQDRGGDASTRWRPIRASSRRTSGEGGGDEVTERRTAPRPSRCCGSSGGHVLRADPHPPGGQPPRAAGRARLPARRQRVRQVDDAEDGARDRAAAERQRCSSTART